MCSRPISRTYCYAEFSFLIFYEIISYVMKEKVRYDSFDIMRGLAMMVIMWWHTCSVNICQY